MDIFELITQSEIDELPEDDSQAFAEFARHAYKSLSNRVAELTEQENWDAIQEARYGFVNVLSGAARKYNVGPFAEIDVPLIKSFNYDDYRQFKTDLDHYLTQVILDNSKRAKRDNILVSAGAKEKFRAYVYHLKDAVASGAFTDAKRRDLLKKLADFEAELEGRRLSLLAVARITLELLAIPGGVWQSAEIANRLVLNVMETVAEAKIEEDEARGLAAPVEPIAISPPRQEAPKRKPSASPPAFESGGMDDDIPF